MLLVALVLCILWNVHAFSRSFPSNAVVPLFTVRLKTTQVRAESESNSDQSTNSGEVQESSEIRRLRTKLQDVYNEIAQLQEQNESEKDKLKKLDEEFGSEIARIKSEFARMKERAVQESENLVNMAIAEALKDLLPLADNYFRAKKAYEPFQTENEKRIFESYATVFKDFNEIVQGYGLTKMETVGQKFDPNYMEAVAAVPSEYPIDTVCAEYQIGYKMGDKLIRPAVVAVSA